MGFLKNKIVPSLFLVSTAIPGKGHCPLIEQSCPPFPPMAETYAGLKSKEPTNQAVENPLLMATLFSG